MSYSKSLTTDSHSLRVQPKVAIPTEYKGITFRSRLEAQCAYMFDALEWEWEYEPKSYMLPNGVSYVPDFYLDAQRMFIECRGYSNKKANSQIAEFGQAVQDGHVGPHGKAILRYAVIKESNCACYRPRHEFHDEGSVIAWCRACAKWVLMGLGEGECPLCFSHGCSISHAYVLSCNAGKILLNCVPSENWDGLIFLPSLNDRGGAL